jgi:hypothetical protein
MNTWMFETHLTWPAAETRNHSKCPLFFGIQRSITMFMRACLWLLSQISRSLLHIFVSYVFNMIYFVHIIIFLCTLTSPSFAISIWPCRLIFFTHFWARFVFHYRLHPLLSEDGGNWFLRNIDVSVPRYNVTSQKITVFIFIMGRLEIVEITCR